MNENMLMARVLPSLTDEIIEEIRKRQSYQGMAGCAGVARCESKACPGPMIRGRRSDQLVHYDH